MNFSPVNHAYRFLNDSGDYVDVGDPEASRFIPALLLRRWTGECWLRITYDDSAVAAKETSLSNEKVTFSTPQFNLRWYKLDAESPHELGGVEYEIVLKQPPATNRLTLAIDVRGLTFHKQTAQNTMPDSFRPENVIDSYAVYHASKSGLFQQSDTYKTGKAFHIYRPQATDGKGAKTWCDLDVDEKKHTLTVTVPQQFLDSAVYPVTVDPTFGYTTAGGSWSNLSTGGGTDYQRGGDATSPADCGTTSTMHFYTRNEADVTGSIYTNETRNGHKDPYERVGDSSEIAVSGVAAWHSAACVHVLSASTIYHLCIWGEITGNTPDVAYDSVAGYDTWRNTSAYSPPWPGTLDPSTQYHDYRHSIYATYTATGGLSIPVAMNQYGTHINKKIKGG